MSSRKYKNHSIIEQTKNRQINFVSRSIVYPINNFILIIVRQSNIHNFLKNDRK